MTNREVRQIQISELRAATAPDSDKSNKLVGYAATFNTHASIGSLFDEIIAPGAFTEAIRSDNVVALVNHDGVPLGRTTAGTLTLSEDNKGLYFEVELPDTQQARDLYTSVQRGDLDSCSFAFQATKESWDYDSDPVLRTIESVKLYDVSIVTYPAYSATSVSARSAEDVLAEARAKQPQPKSLDNIEDSTTHQREGSPSTETVDYMSPVLDYLATIQTL